MQAMRSSAVVRRALVLAAVAILCAAGPGYAFTGTSRNSSGSGGTGDGKGDLGARAQVVTYTYPSGKPDGTAKPLVSTDVSWTPPPCWIGPIADPASFKQMILDEVKNTDVPGQANYALEAMDELRRHYSDNYTWEGGGKGYKDFNLDQQGKGMFWGPVENPDSDSPHRFDCNGTLPFWVAAGDRPPAGTQHVITPEMLSELAYAHTHVPGVTIETNPVDTQTVNLPTWVWLKENYSPVSVRASVDLGGGQQIWAQTTATPTSVHITPGTPDAKVFPAGGDCAIAADGTVGAPYSGDAKADPPCGVTYLRSTDNRPPFALDVTATWTVRWTGSDGGGPHPLPEGVIDDPRPVTVHEYQSVNR
ncbi:hypothetical protein VSR01_26400 [Actinacidiphila sp. DG2A-62]|uniref:hypothetical protein n=1 Tax=Actinacidiphila sp. DG2A-62 TaxID=3108821 RepID=UPI002DBC9F3E|nr:hypothetical protein [Actinacidiphila sp. DG2A-62]MEC3996849.1 hypothetical protein [Actinacidiphila sp. DG2A-62]